jgi:hypothetical protein
MSRTVEVLAIANAAESVPEELPAKLPLPRLTELLYNLTPPVVVENPIAIPTIASEENELHPLPLISEIRLLLITRLLDELPVLIMIPLPPHPPVFVDCTPLILFAFIVELKQPVEISIPLGSTPVDVRIFVMVLLLIVAPVHCAAKIPPN